VGRCVVGCEQCSHPTTQRPTTATNHIQQNQRSTPYAVTHGLWSPEDGHNDARNMLRQKLIINIWLLHLVGFLSLHSLSSHSFPPSKPKKVHQCFDSSLCFWFFFINPSHKPAFVFRSFSWIINRLRLYYWRSELLVHKIKSIKH